MPVICVQCQVSMKVPADGMGVVVVETYNNLPEAARQRLEEIKAIGKARVFYWHERPARVPERIEI